MQLCVGTPDRPPLGLLGKFFEKRACGTVQELLPHRFAKRYFPPLLLVLTASSKPEPAHNSAATLDQWRRVDYPAAIAGLLQDFPVSNNNFDPLSHRSFAIQLPGLVQVICVSWVSGTMKLAQTAS